MNKIYSCTKWGSNLTQINWFLTVALVLSLTTSGISQLTVTPVNAEDLLKLVQDSDAEVVIVNIWATWCQPCVEEFPDLMRVYREFKEQGLKLILVSADFKKQEQGITDFLVTQGVDFPTYLKKGDDMKFINTLKPEWSGALPATLIFNRDGVRKDFWVGKASYEKFKQAVETTLNNNKDS